MGNLVSLVKVQEASENLKDSISEALAMIDFNIANSVKSVVIKPNLCYYWNPSTGYTTDPELVAGLIDYVREKYGEQVNIKIAEADASAMRTKFAFPVLGYDKLAADKKVELVNLSENELVDTPVSVNGQNFSFQVPKLLLKADLFINVPKLKVMKATTITCAMKNLFGCMGYPKKVKFHPLLNEAIVGMNKILHPHITLVDGMVALGKHPIRLDLIMAGVDPFSVDWIACKLMGYNPAEVKFLKIAMKENVGKKAGITTKGEDPAKYRKIFPKPGISSSKYLWSIQFSMLKIYKKLSGDIVPPVLEE